MREIKFRAFYGGKMYRVNLIDWDTGILELETTENDAWEVKIFEVELMQFTGLLDKNGKEIYEGDILFADYGIQSSGAPYSETGVVKWGDACGCDSAIRAWCCYSKEGGHIYSRWGGENKDESELEVVGNIYESPELLNPKHENNL